MALEQFAHRGYTGTSLRDVAAAAGVDPSLVYHFFHTKDGLFTATLDLIGSVPVELSEVFAQGPDGLARRLALAYLSAWEDPITGPRLLAIARATSDSPAAAALVRRSLESSPVIAQATALADGTAEAIQALLSQLLGTAFARYVLAVRPLADLALADLVDLLEPTLEAAVVRAQLDHRPSDTSVR